MSRPPTESVLARFIRYAAIDTQSAEDVADAISWVATRPAHVNVDLLVIKPRAQAAAHKVHREA